MSAAAPSIRERPRRSCAARRRWSGDEDAGRADGGRRLPSRGRERRRDARTRAVAARAQARARLAASARNRRGEAAGGGPITARVIGFVGPGVAGGERTVLGVALTLGGDLVAGVGLRSRIELRPALGAIGLTPGGRGDATLPIQDRFDAAGLVVV